MKYFIIKEFEENLPSERTIVSFWIENKWIIILLDNGIKIKIINY